MAAHSMTGFGRAEIDLPGTRLAVELATVNQKNLQVSVHGPDAWPTLESAATGWIRARLQRGKVTARVTQAAAGGPGGTWDLEATRLQLTELERLAQALGTPWTPPSPELLLKLAESRRGQAAALPELATVETIVQAAFARALDQLVAMRAREGSALAADLRGRLRLLAGFVRTMEASEQGAVARHREALLRRLKDAGLALDVSDERVLKELAFFAERCDITEEVVRLRSHLEQFEAELGQANGGRKLDFLVQELLREVNTIGSKAAEIPTTRAVLEAKTEIERIREQVQNLE
ncbi:MAG: YicC family protein [Opitutia bacterium]